MRNVLEIAREKAFWIMDAAQGGKVGRHYRQIKQLLEEEDIAAGNNIKKDSLEKILTHAVQTVPYYNSCKNFRSVNDFPVINKTHIRDNFEKFTSIAISKEEQIPVVTSGSTGTPFKVLHNRDKRHRNSADTMYFAERAGFKVGDRLVYMKIWSDNNKKSGLQTWMQNMVAQDVISFNEKEHEALIKMMESNSSTFGFLGYSSALELICKYLDRHNYVKVKTTLASAISMSESLNEYTKQGIRKYFGVPALSRYSNLENGILAQQIPEDSNRYLVNTASYLLEIFKVDSDTLAEDGELGRIVVTDFYNLALPMIRYDTGDIGSISKERDEFGNTYLDVVEGRKLDLIYATDGRLLSSYIVYKNMWQYTEIVQYQLVQHGEKDYTFKANLEGVEFKREKQLVDEFKTYLGQDANFTVEYVSEIPLLASGKRRKIVNTYHNKQIIA